MIFVILGICLFFGFLVIFLLLLPRPTAAGALLQEVTRPVRPADMPEWRTALNIDYLAKPFAFIRSLIAPEPNPELVRRLMLAGYRRPAHADLFLGSRLAIPAVLGILVALFATDNAITYFILAIGIGFFAPDFWLSWAVKKRR